MPRSLAAVVPFVPCAAGLAVGIDRFHAERPVLALACILGGMLLMVVAIFRLPGASRS